MTSPIEQVAALTIGTVEFVSPAEIKVLLETDAPQTTALNTGAPTGFPRINGYVLIPNETGAVVGMIVWLGVERSAFPKRTGMKDFGLIDIPFPLRKLALTPLGTLVHKKGEGADGDQYKLERGVAAFPSVGDPVLLPTVAQLKSIIEAADPADQRVIIGTSPLASNAKVTVDPNKIFGRHLAVLGNTGSGKSCSVAGLIRWSLEASRKEREREGRNEKTNARFIILDPNGEYSTAYDDLIKEKRARVFRVPPVDEGYEKLVLPAWMWNSYEWCAFTEASSKVQRPILMRALRELRSATAAKDSSGDSGLIVTLLSFYRSLVKELHAGPEAYIDFPGKQNFGQKLEVIAESISVLSENSVEHKDTLHDISEKIMGILAGRKKNAQGYFPPFSLQDVEAAIQAFDEALKGLPTPLENMGINEDCPSPFDPDELVQLYTAH